MKINPCVLMACFFSPFFLSGQALLYDTIPGSSVSFSMIQVEGNDSISDFFIGTHEVTHDMYVLFKRKEFDSSASDLRDDYTPDAVTRPSPPYEDLTWGMGSEGGYPAVSMTQQGAIRYCQWLYLKTGRFYRLPTDAEWTHVASQQEDQGGWFYENSDEKFHKTGTFPGQKEIYDLYGNVMEWTLDRRVLKGGSYMDDAGEIEATTIIKYDRKWQQRDPQIPKSNWWLTDGPFVGFRLLSPVEALSAEEVEAFFREHIK